MHLRRFLALLVFCPFAVTAIPAHGATETIMASHTYVLGDSDSKEQARALCYMNAKRKVLDQAGVFIEGSSEVKNYQLTKDQIQSYSAAILSVEVVKEDFVLTNGVNTLTLTVKADVDVAEVKSRLARIMADKGVQATILTQQQQIRELERQVQALSQKLWSAPGSNKAIRKDRDDIDLEREYRKDAEHGDIEAQFKLGRMYIYSTGIPQSDSEAERWLRRAAEQGHAAAQFELGKMYYNGKGLPKDLRQAVMWIRKAAEQGNADGQFFVGGFYAEGVGLEKDAVQAVVWYRKAADQGHASAQYFLGGVYFRGRGVNRDYTQAAYWWRKAAEQGHAQAQNDLGWLYHEGNGVARDYGEAVAWTRKAAEQGNAYAQEGLGEMYEAGDGVARDWVQAYKWYNLAAEKQLPDAIMRRRSLEPRMTSAQLAEAQHLARDWQEAFEKRKRLRAGNR